MSDIGAFNKFELLSNKTCYKACGYTDDDLDRPIIGIANSYNEMVSGHMNLRALAEQVATVLAQQHAGGDLHPLARHRASSSRRPAWSRANCQATRPEREPRISAHCSASWRDEAISSSLAPKLRSQCATMSRYSSWLKG